MDDQYYVVDIEIREYPWKYRAYDDDLKITSNNTGIQVRNMLCNKTSRKVLFRFIKEHTEEFIKMLGDEKKD